MVLDLFAGVPVADRARAIAWYDRLLGDVATFEPNNTEWVWTVSPHRHVYIDVRPDTAGGGMVTLFVDDYDAVLAAASGRGVDPDREETYDNGVRKAIYGDPDGNEVGIGGAPSTDAPADDVLVEVSALAVNLAIPEALRWIDSRDGREFELHTLNVRLLAGGRLAARAYGRPVEGGRRGYVSFPVPDRPELEELILVGARRAAEMWATSGGG